MTGADKPEIKPSGPRRAATQRTSSYLPAVLILLAAILLGWAVIGQQSGDGDTPITGPGKPDALDGVATDWLEARVDGLDQKLEFVSGQISDLEARLVTTDKLEAQIARLNETVDRLNRLTANLETGHAGTASGPGGQPASTPAASVAMAATGAGQQAIAAMTGSTTAPQDSTTPSQQAPGTEDSKRSVQKLYEKDNKDKVVTGENDWKINLISSPIREDAVNFANRAKSKGVDTELRQVSVRGTPYWRVQISGFATYDDALAHSNSIKKTLGLQETWIYSK